MSVKYFKVRKLQKLLREVLRFYKTSPSLYNIFWLPHAFEIGFKCDHVCFLSGVCSQITVSQVQQIETFWCFDLIFIWEMIEK